MYVGRTVSLHMYVGRTVSLHMYVGRTVSLHTYVGTVLKFNRKAYVTSISYSFLTSFSAAFC